MTPIQEAWVVDLETTDAKQAVEMLVLDGGYCCLGRACAVHFGDKRWWRGKDKLPPSYAKFLGLRNEIGSFYLNALTDEDRELCGCAESLAELNDTLRLSFKEIAAFIRRNERAVFE